MNERVNVYVASPYAAIRCSDDIRRHLAKKIALDECTRIMNAGFTPISPVLRLEGKFDEKTQRDEALKAGLEMLKQCDYYYESTHLDTANSQGVKSEREFAKANDIPKMVLNKDGQAEICLWL
ncbi:hypothetical protein [Campylobacter hyointestinalis]|uniref:DUF7768 domain-containing protein n=1 Tax=Campylobacter hyointestinalis TaxID=198 RepID=UPI001BD54CBE|nr:hypothetical protein [Campylobacter hyointestinalis]MBT0611975.1 hypothetical protein [Campylobacter hyointestinalis subsp. hyointestinalis]MDY2999486.1 hypothetical protein [Campylobacter hyointestinalis]